MPKLITLVCSVIFCATAYTDATAKAGHKQFADRDDVRQFVSEMSQMHGFDSAELLSLFSHTPVMPKVIALIKPPTDPQTRSWVAYRQRFVEPNRIAAGRRFMTRYADALAQAESRYGVPREIIASIIGVETIYGRNMGGVNTFAALTNLAFDYPPRADLFRAELGELLLMAREAKRDPRGFKGSFAGALGLPQFLPSSVRAYAVDFNNDGTVDILTDPIDAIGSVANFLNFHGWKSLEPIAVLVDARGDGLARVLENGVIPNFLPSAYAALNVAISPVGANDSAFIEFPSALIDFTSPNAPTEYRLGYQNFYVITRYNRSRFYAGAVMDLAAELVTK